MAAKLSLFLAELKRRKVFRAATVYIVVGVGVLGAAEVILDPLGLEALRPYLVILVLLGFPIALVLAWAYEIRPEASRPVEPAEQETAAAPQGPGAATATAAERRKSIVVLPFDNMSPDPGDAWFSDGLTEEITTNLSGIHALRVISRNSAMVLKGAGRDTRAIAKELGVRYVLEGSVRKAGDALRITAQLIDGSSDEHLWAEKYDGVLSDVFSIQETVSLSITKALQLELETGEEKRIVEPSFRNLKAYECHVRAQAEIWQLSPDSLERAVELIERGLEIAADSDLLHAAMGQIHFMHVDNMNGPPETYSGLLEQARACADRALAVNPGSAAAHSLLGLIAQARGDTQSLIRHFSDALRLDPNNAIAMLCLGYWRAAGGWDLEGARDFLERVQQVDPLGSMNKGAPGWLHWMRGEYGAALEGWMDWQRDCEEVKSPYRIFLAYLHAADGNVAEGVRLVDQARDDSPEHVLTSLGTLLKHAWLGDRRRALAAVTDHVERAVAWDDIWSLLLTCGFAAAGDTERALQWLDHTIDYGICNVAYLRDHEPFLARLRTDDGFEKLMEKARSRSDSRSGVRETRP